MRTALSAFLAGLALAAVWAWTPKVAAGAGAASAPAARLAAGLPSGGITDCTAHIAAVYCRPVDRPGVHRPFLFAAAPSGYPVLSRAGWQRGGRDGEGGLARVAAVRFPLLN